MTIRPIEDAPEPDSGAGDEQRVTAADIVSMIPNLVVRGLPVPVRQCTWFYDERRTYPSLQIIFENGQAWSLHVFEHKTGEKA